jgi:hypothetical protein
MSKINSAAVVDTSGDALWASYEMVEALCKLQGRTIEDAIAAPKPEFVDLLLLDGAARAVDLTTIKTGKTDEQD